MKLLGIFSILLLLLQDSVSATLVNEATEVASGGIELAARATPNEGFPASREEAERALISAFSQAAERDLPVSERALEDAIIQAAEKYPALKRALEALGPEEDPVLAREHEEQLDAAIARALERVRIEEGDTSAVARQRPLPPLAVRILGGAIVGGLVGFLMRG